MRSEPATLRVPVPRGPTPLGSQARTRAPRLLLANILVKLVLVGEAGAGHRGGHGGGGRARRALGCARAATPSPARGHGGDTGAGAGDTSARGAGRGPGWAAPRGERTRDLLARSPPGARRTPTRGEARAPLSPPPRPPGPLPSVRAAPAPYSPSSCLNPHTHRTSALYLHSFPRLHPHARLTLHRNRACTPHTLRARACTRTAPAHRTNSRARAPPPHLGRTRTVPAHCTCAGHPPRPAQATTEELALPRDTRMPATPLLTHTQGTAYNEPSLLCPEGFPSPGLQWGTGVHMEDYSCAIPRGLIPYSPMKRCCQTHPAQSLSFHMHSGFLLGLAEQPRGFPG